MCSQCYHNLKAPQTVVRRQVVKLEEFITKCYFTPQRKTLTKSRIVAGDFRYFQESYSAGVEYAKLHRAPLPDVRLKVYG
jgi:hypothetical protein